MGFLPSSNKELPPIRKSEDPADRIEYSLDSLIPDNPNKPYDMRELITKVVDDRDFLKRNLIMLQILLLVLQE